ncbi:hypothetical protein K439DRAFT_1641028, partial [Ramaria rubella]
TNLSLNNDLNERPPTLRMADILSQSTQRITAAISPIPPIFMVVCTDSARLCFKFAACVSLSVCVSQLCRSTVLILSTCTAVRKYHIMNLCAKTMTATTQPPRDIDANMTTSLSPSLPVRHADNIPHHPHMNIVMVG